MGNPGLYQNLQNTQLVGIENGILTISAGSQAEWMQTRMTRNALLALRALFDEEIIEVQFVE